MGAIANVQGIAIPGEQVTCHTRVTQVELTHTRGFLR